MNNRTSVLATHVYGVTAVASLIAGVSAAGDAEAAEKEADRSSLTLEEIVVTAQKRKERLQDVPMSISVLGGDSLDRGSSRGVADVLSQVGGVSLSARAPGEVIVTVRGVTSSAGTSTTAYYQDEIPIAFIRTGESPDTNAFDLRQVEVLRGPQGTLYGAAALGGVVRVLSNDANLDAFEAKGRLRGSSTEDAGDNYGGDMAINVPLVPGKLAIRGVASYTDLSGFIDSSLDGQRNINDTRARAYRLKVGYQPSDSLSVNLGLSRSEINNGAPSTGTNAYTTSFSSSQSDDRVLDAYNLIAEYRWSSLSLLSSTGYFDYTRETLQETLLGGTTRVTLVTEIPLRSFSQEIRLLSQIEGPWRWSAGAFYKDTTETNLFVVGPGGGLPFPSLLEEHSKSYAVFGEATRSFNDGRFELTGGLRHFEDRLTTTESSRLATGTSILVPPVTTDFSEPTGRLMFAYKPKDDAMFYGSVATGFRSGMNQTPTILASNPDFGSLDPDSLITYELGAKGRLFDGTLDYDTAVYYTDWKDIQQSIVVDPGFAARLNAGGADGVGVDLGASYHPTDAFALNISLGWSDLKFNEDVFQQGVLLIADGARVNNAAEWTGSLGGSYSTATPWAGMRTLFTANYAYGSEREARSLVGGRITVDSSEEYEMLNATAGLEGRHWSVSIVGDNLLNADGVITPARPLQAFTGIRPRPRTIGLQVAFDF